MALSGPAGLAVAKRIYRLALPRFDELVKPYATVVEIDRAEAAVRRRRSTAGRPTTWSAACATTSRTPSTT